MLCDINLCTGCLACTEICPKQAIKINNDEKGFWNVSIDSQECINCGLCARVCPQNNRKQIEEKNSISLTYAFRHKNDEILKRSTSGGAFSALSDVILNKNGTIYGAVYDRDLNCYHSRATNREERDRMCGSKYQQSWIKGVYSQIEKDLRDDKFVLFSGTPCQVDAVQRYLVLKKVDTTKFFSVDFVCHGVPSPQLFKEYVQYSLPNENEVQVICRDKIKSWRHPLFHMVGKKMEKGTVTYIDPYMNLFFENAILRESCYQCNYAKCKRVSDITMSDCWAAHKVCKQMDDDRGVSNIFINTKKGNDLYNLLDKTVMSIKVDLLECIQQPLKSPPEKAIYTEQFWECYKKNGAEYSIDHFSVISYKDIIWYTYIIPLLKKVKLYGLIRRMLG